MFSSAPFSAHRPLRKALLGVWVLLMPLLASSETFAQPTAPEADQSRPAPKGKGVIWGVITDSKYKEPLPEAPVSVLGTNLQVYADFDGRYRLELPPGTYSIRFQYELQKPLRLDNVQVVAGEVRQIDAVLDPTDQAVETTEIVAEARKDTVEGQILKRQRSASVRNSIGRTEIAKNPDSNAAEAAQRVVGATIVGGRFVYVRGLGERYSNATLNGAPLPSPEPDRAAVPLDLFPALVLDSIDITKGFTPDMPGDFAGGSVQVATRSIPDEFLFSASLSLGFNTQSTFRQRLDHASSATDWLAFDSGLRSLPESISDAFRYKRTAPKPDGTSVSDEDLVAPGRALNTRMSSFETFTPPNHSLSVVAGDGFTLGNGHRIGVLGSINYSQSYQIREEILREYQPDAGSERGLRPKLDFNVLRGGSEVKWGGFGSIAYEISPKHRFNLILLRSQIANDETNFFSGSDNNTGTRLVDTQFVFVSRALSMGQLSGRHELTELGDAEVGWDVTLANASRQEPDRRDTVYRYDPRFDAWNYLDGSESGRHFFAEQAENSIGGKLDWTQPLVEGSTPTSLKLGGLVNLKDREFDVRRFALRRSESASLSDLRCESPSYQQRCADDLFRDENIDRVLRLEENTRDTDAYTAKLDVYAAYLMADVSVTRDLRVVVGERVEITDQVIDPRLRFGETSATPGASLDSVDLLPAVSASYATSENTKLRLGVSRTLARPQLRELAPFAFADYFGGRLVSGNPDLKLTTITNADLRFEYFPSLREVLSFSVFYKDFVDPIEPVLIPSSTTSTLTFRNAQGANLVGVELEGRKNLGFLTPALTDFGLIANLTLSRSRIEVPQTGNRFITNLSRPLVNQAPWVLNLALTYENDFGTNARLLYNVSGKTLVEVGTEGLDDAYRHPLHRLDLVISQKLSEHFQVELAAQNLLNAEYLVTQGEDEQSYNVVNRYRNGRTFSLGASYTY